MSERWIEFRSKYFEEVKSNNNLNSKLQELSHENQVKNEDLKNHDDKLNKTIEQIKKDYENRIIEIKSSQLQSDKTLNESKNKIIEDLQRTLDETKSELNNKLNESLKLNDKLNNETQ